MLISKGLAEYLAAKHGDGDYYAKKIRGVWVVWSRAADHAVEFAGNTVVAAELDYIREALQAEEDKI